MSGKTLSLYPMLLLLTVSAPSQAFQGPKLFPLEQLGKSIFFDKTLSIERNQACAVCHGPEVGWTGPEESFNEHGAVYEGSIEGRFGDRKPPSSAYATQSPIFHFTPREGGMFVGGNFWDGRATGINLGNPAADQAQGPFLNPVEQALPDSACVVYRVCTVDYPVSFEAVWGFESCAISWPSDIETACSTEGATVNLTAEDRAKSAAAFDNIALSIAAYEASPAVNAFTSKFDWARRGLARLTGKEQQGFELFKGKAKCASCHTVRGREPVFADFTYENIGLPRNPENPAVIADSAFIDGGLGQRLKQEGYDKAVFEAEWGKFKVPTLRNVDKRPNKDFVKAYGHNGFFKTLEGIVHFYNTRDVLPECPPELEPITEAKALANNCWPAPEVTQNLNTEELGDLALTPEEEAALVAFLKTLSDGFILRRLPFPR